MFVRVSQGVSVLLCVRVCVCLFVCLLVSWFVLQHINPFGSFNAESSHFDKSFKQFSLA